MKSFKKVGALVCTLATALALVACGGSSDSPSDDSSSAPSEETATLVGKPWVTSILQGNLPPEQPEQRDDLFTHDNYDYLAAHQLMPGSTMGDHAVDLREANVKLMKDESRTGHDIDQLRIFFDQAADAKTLKEKGLQDIQPYLDRIDAVGSIEEMNELLTGDDFPFSPFVLANIILTDTRDVNVVSVNPNLALVDPIGVGGAYYQDTDDEQAQESMLAAIQNTSFTTLVDFSATGMSDDEVGEVMNKILEFERAHGKYADYNGRYSMKDFGEAAEAARDSVFTLDELCDACPNFPMRGTLEKLGKAGSPRYVSIRDWLGAINELWTDDNLEAIKLVAKAKVLGGTRPYRDPTPMNDRLEEAGQPVTDAESFAYEAYNQQDTFAVLLSETYVNEVLGENCKERLTKLSQDLVSTYKDIMGNTPWVSEESKQRILEKLDHMTLNVLEPVGGYYDFSGLELTPTEEGGTLIGNYLKLRQYRLDQESKMVGQPAVAASPWFTIRPTEMNAFYDPASNSINILPGFVTSLVYTDDMDEADLLSGIGFTIGHEMSHGFDYLGAQYDAYGTPTPIFGDADVDAFVLKCSTLASYYKTLEVKPGVTVNGENVVTEAAADLCGMHAILEMAGKIEGVDYQKFFGNVSNVWAQTVPEAFLPNLLLDTHTLNHHRVNVNAQMFDPLYDELDVKEGDGMYLTPEERINIWGPNS